MKLTHHGVILGNDAGKIGGGQTVEFLNSIKFSLENTPSGSFPLENWWLVKVSKQSNDSIWWVLSGIHEGWRERKGNSNLGPEQRGQNTSSWVQPAPTSSRELIIKLQQIWVLVDLTVGSLQSAMVGVFTTLKWRNATTQGFFHPQNQLLNIYYNITTIAYRQQWKFYIYSQWL